MKLHFRGDMGTELIIERVISQNQADRAIKAAVDEGVSIWVLNYPGGKWGQRLVELIPSLGVEKVSLYPNNELVSSYDFEVIDIHVEVVEPKEHKVKVVLFRGDSRLYVEAVQNSFNGMPQLESLDLCELDQSSIIAEFVQLREMGVSLVNQVIRVARIIANLYHSETIAPVHFAEAVRYRRKSALSIGYEKRF